MQEPQDLSDQSLPELQRTIEVFNDLAKYYQASGVEDLVHQFISGARRPFPNRFIEYLKTTPCNTDMTDETWAQRLSETGCPAENIAPFSQIVLRPATDPKNNVLLKDQIAAYARARRKTNPQPSLYTAIQDLGKDYRQDPAFQQHLELLADSQKISSNDAFNLFLAAYQKQNKVSALASYLELMGERTPINSGKNASLYKRISTTLLELKQYTQTYIANSNNYTDSFINDSIEELIPLAMSNNPQDLSKFYAKITAMIRLIHLCGTDQMQLSKTFRVILNEPIESLPLAGIQKILALARKQKTRTVENWFDGYPEAPAWKEMQSVFNGAYAETMTHDALEYRLPPPQKLEDFELFPGTKLVEVLLNGAIEDEKKPMRTIIAEAITDPKNLVQSNATDLETIATLYGIDLSTTKQLFNLALLSTDDTLITEGTLIAAFTKTTISLNAAFAQLNIVKQQLTTLLANNREVLLYAERYIESQEATLLKYASTNDTNAVQQMTQTFNIVQAIGNIIRDNRDAPYRLKTGSEREQRNITLLAEQLNTLGTKSPKKTAKIQAALSEVLSQNPTMTFDQLVGQMRDPSLTTESVKKLKDIMGTHRNLFYRFLSLFCNIETKTTQLFREKIIEQKNLTEKDLGHAPLDEETLKGWFHQ